MITMTRAFLVVAAVFVVICIVAIATADDFAGRANSACERHDGVRDLRRQHGAILCADGTAVRP